MKKISSLLTSVLFVLISNSSQAETLGFKILPGDSSQGLKINVTDEITGSVLNNVRVTFQNLAGTEKQQGVTDAGGAATLPWVSGTPRVLVVQQSGYASVTLVGFQGASVSVQMKLLKVNQKQVLASGTMTGFPSFALTSPNQTEVTESILGKVKWGFVIHSVNSFDLLNFDLNSFISPLNDVINVQGEHNIPSNIVLPKQSLLFGTIKINKPTYRLPVTANKLLTLSGLQGEVDASDLQNADINVINKVKLTRVAVAAPMTPKADFSATVDGSYSLALKYTAQVTAPGFKSDVLVVAASDIGGDGQSIVPCDIKLAMAASANQATSTVNLSLPPDLQRKRDFIIGIAMGESGRLMSGVIKTPTGANTSVGNFLDLIDLKDKVPLPALITLSAPPKGIAAAVFNNAEGPASFVYLLPSAGATTLKTQDAVGNFKVSQYSEVNLELSDTVDSNNFDGTTALQSLSRFTRTQATVTP